MRHWVSTNLHSVYGDLWYDHLLVDDGGQLIGVIDFGSLHVGDPVAETSRHYCIWVQRLPLPCCGHIFSLPPCRLESPRGW